LFERCCVLRRRVEECVHNDGVWREYTQTLDVLLRVEEQLQRQYRTEPVVYTTAEMAQRLGVTIKTLLAWKREGVIQPSFAHGKRLKWRLSDALR